MVRVALLDEDVAIEAAHLGNGKDADAAEGAGGHGQDLALGHVTAEVALGVALQAVEGHVGGGDVALEGTAGKVGVGPFRLEQAVLDQLVLNGTVGAHLAAGGIAAVEAHEGVGQAVVEVALDVLVVDVARHGVVDVEQRDRVAGGAHADILGEGAVDVDLTGNRDAAADQARVDVARLEAELGREGRPALVGEGDVLAGALVGLGPVKKRELELRHAGEQVGIVAALPHLGGHVGADVGDARVALVLAVGDEKVELGVLLDLDAQLVEALDRCVAGKEVLRARAEGDDLEVADADDGAGHGHEVGHHLGDVGGGAHGITGYVSLHMAHAQVVAAVEHAAVGVAAAVDHVAVALGRGHVHDGAVEALGDEGLGRLGPEVAEKDREGVDARGLGLGEGDLHVGLGLDGLLDLDDVKPGRGARGHDGLAAAHGELDREAVARDRDDAQLDLRDVARFHSFSSPATCKRDSPFCRSHQKTCIGKPALGTVPFAGDLPFR